MLRAYFRDEYHEEPGMSDETATAVQVKCPFCASVFALEPHETVVTFTDGLSIKGFVVKPTVSKVTFICKNPSCGKQLEIDNPLVATASK